MVRALTSVAQQSPYSTRSEASNRIEESQRHDRPKRNDDSNSRYRVDPGVSQISNQDSDPGSQLSTQYSERLALRVRSRSRIRVNDDGSLSATNKTNLRFRYELETSDGQKIQLQAKAKIKQSIRQDENGDLAIKTRVKLQFSLVQEDVSSGLAPLAGSEDAQNSIQAFSDVINGLVSDFTEQGSIDADQLVSSVLDAFNELFQSFSGAPAIDSDPTPDAEVLEGTAVNQGEAPDGVDASELISTQANELLGAATDAIQTDDQTDAAEQNQEVASSEESSEVENAVNASEIDDANGVESSDVVDEQESTPSAEVDSQLAQETASTASASESPADTRREILQQVQIRFVQSFSQVIRTLTPEGDGQGSTFIQQQSRFQLAAQIQYQSQAVEPAATSFIA